MLTSPVNVTIAAANGAGLKANTAASDNSARREPAHLPVPSGQPAETVIEPELPSNSPLNHVNAVSATVGNRTILQELSLNIAIMLRIPRRPDENLTALFLRIIATIEAMPQAERLAFEMRAGLKPLKITLADLLMALRKPDGPEAARLTAMAEAPAAVPGRTAVTAATTTYLEEGTSTGHTEETLAMRAAARNSAAGQSVFSAESKMRAEAPPADAKVLQDQLKSMFEPGESRPAPAPESASAGDAGPHAPADHADVPPSIVDAGPDAAVEEAPLPEAKQVALPESKQALPQPAGRENVVISSASLKLDQPTLDKIRNAAQAIADQASEAAHADPERPGTDRPVEKPADRAEAGDRRLQTLLTLKGLAEAVTAIPSKAAELLAGVVAEGAAPPADMVEAGDLPDRAAAGTPLPSEALDDIPLEEFAVTSGEPVAETEAEFIAANNVVAEHRPDDGVPAEEPVEEHAEAAMAQDRQAAVADKQQLGRTDLAQHAVPFAYAQLQPAREEQVQPVSEEETREETDEDDEQDGGEDRERRRPRDEYDAIHDAPEEDEPSIVINRDSSEADRAFALYQRMGGF